MIVSVVCVCASVRAWWYVIVFGAFDVHRERTGVLNHTRIAPGVAPSVVTGALWRQAVRVYTRGHGSEVMP